MERIDDDQLSAKHHAEGGMGGLGRFVDPIGPGGRCVELSDHLEVIEKCLKTARKVERTER